MTLTRESDIQAAILIYVTSRPGSYFERRNTGASKYRDANGKERLVRFGVKGAPDIQGVLKTEWGGQAIGIECKRLKGGIQSSDQKQWQRNFERGGGIYILARSVDDVRDRLAMEGLVEA